MSSKEKRFHETTASHGTHIRIWSPEEDNHTALQAVLDMLRSRGWTIQTDQEILERYPILADDYFEGQKGDLKFKAKQLPACSNLEFYQDINTKNRHGGRYDFDKLIMMPYLIRCQFLVELKHIKNFLVGLGYTDQSDPILKTAEGKIKLHFVKSCHHPQESMSFNLKNIDGQTSDTYNSTGEDGKIIRNGDIKYFRDHKGRLMRGTVYHNINNMWWVLINKHYYRNMADFELFDLTPENSARKIVRHSGHHNPKSRWMPTVEEMQTWQKEAITSGKAGRVKTINEFLEYLYSIDWMTRCFQFVLKKNGRIGLVETKGSPCLAFLGVPRKERVFDPPRVIPIYPKPQQMSSTESGWIESLRDYIVHGPGPRVSTWFCTDSNGEGSTAHYWPGVREKLIKMGAMAVTAIEKATS